MKETIERYRNHVKEVQTNNASCVEDVQHLKHLAAGMAKKIELLEVAKRKLLGGDLGSSTIEELVQLEQQLEKSVCVIRARKMQVYNEQIEQLHAKEKMLAAENAILNEKCPVRTQEKPDKRRENVRFTGNGDNSDVETDLFIGPRQWRIKYGRPI